MGYRLTEAEIKKYQDAVDDGVFTSTGIDVWFTTTREFIEEVLPPCFTPGDEPIGLIQFSTGNGAGMPYYASTIFVSAKFGDIEGFYDLTMLLSGDMNIIFGRELYGESKKRGTFGMEVDLPKVTAFAARGGTKVIQISGEFTGESVPRETQRTNLQLKAFLNGDASDLEYDPVVVIGRVQTHYNTCYEGVGTIELTSTSGDPCGTVPIVSVDGAVFGERVANFLPNESFPVDGKEGYLPYIVGRSYDFVE